MPSSSKPSIHGRLSYLMHGSSSRRTPLSGTYTFPTGEPTHMWVPSYSEPSPSVKLTDTPSPEGPHQVLLLSGSSTMSLNPSRSMYSTAASFSLISMLTV